MKTTITFRFIPRLILLVLTVVLLADFIVQPLVFLHHLVLMSPGLALLTGMFIAQKHESIVQKYRTVKGPLEHKIEMLSLKKRRAEFAPFAAVLMIGIVVSSGLASYGLVAQDKPGQLVYGEKVAAWTSPDDWMISGEPLITSYAERLTPPSMVNVGTRVYPVMTGDDVLHAIFEYHPAVIMISYRFLEPDVFNVIFFLDSHGYSKVASDFMGEWSGSAFGAFEDAEAPMVFVRDDIIEAYDLPTEEWSA